MRHQTASDLITAVLATANVFLAESQRLFRPCKLTAAQFNVLNVLARRAEGMSQRELSDVLVVDRSNVTGLADRMSRAGWVRRSDDPRDRRVYRLTLTPSGRRLWSKVEPRYQNVVDCVTARLSVQQMAGVVAALKEMEQAAGRWKLTDL